jgi:hypothetical protein
MTPISQNALLLFLTIGSFALACWIARYPRKAAAGVPLGVAAGVTMLLVASGAVGFIGHVLPFGQLDFWLAQLSDGIW